MKYWVSLTAAIAFSTSAAFGAQPLPPRNGQKPSVAPAASDVGGPAIVDPGLLYTQVRPCRVFSKKSSAPLSTKYKSFAIAGTIGFEVQGGTRGGCGVPASASSVVVALTKTSGSAPATLRARASDAEPYTLFKLSPNQTSSMTLPIADGRLEIATSSDSTDLYGDVVGYFAPQLTAFLLNDGQTLTATSRVIRTERIEVGHYRVTFDRDIVGCAIAVNVYGGYYSGSGYATAYNAVDILTWSNGSDGTPAPLDLNTQVAVHC